ncbi:MAG: c-type cytochrome [Alphaproteobacteria bacterium]|nr:c-type cytochrome [Alphaproteobacteria bacterium]
MPSPRNKPLILGGLVVGGLAVLALGFYADERYEIGELEAKAQAMTMGSVVRGQQAFGKYGCGGCHTVHHIPAASGMVGPPLDGVAARAIIGGRLSNTPEHLRQWIEDPQGVSPGTAMPNLGVTKQDSRDIAAFLYTRV